MAPLITAPSLWALVPLLIYLIMVFAGRRILSATLIAILASAILSGLGPTELSKMTVKGLGSFLGQIGLIIMMGSGLGELMNQSKVNHTIVTWIVNKIGVNTEKKAIITTIVCSVIICALLGTLAGGNAIIAPILIPVVAAAGLRPGTVGAIFQSAGETGLIWGPLSPPVVGLLGIIGISYWDMMLYAALPFGIIWLVVIYFVALRLQKRAPTETYPAMDLESETFVATPANRRSTAVFVATFFIMIVYAMLTKKGTSFVPVMMITLAVLTGIAGKMSLDDIFKFFCIGMGKMVSMFLAFVMLDVFIEGINVGGGFEALSVHLLALVETAGRESLLFIASFVGGFGVEGAAVAQIKITHELFAAAVEKFQIPMQMWAIALIAASRITTSVYPTANMLGQMGLAESTDLKAMLIGGWAVSLAALVYIGFWGYLGERLFF